MASTTTIDLGPIAHALGLPSAQVETVIRLLDAGNTVPFITRYRKDQTGGLDEEQIRQIESRVGKLRQLAERKQTILRSIEAQHKLTPELAALIEGADSIKRLEDLYLPFKPRKQTLSTLARDRGLEPLAAEVLSAAPSAADLDARARDFVNSDKQVQSAADALLGVGHILAEQFSERADLRGRLRRIFKRSGKLVSARIETDKDKEAKPVEAAAAPAEPSAEAMPVVADNEPTPAQMAAPLAEVLDAPPEVMEVAAEIATETQSEIATEEPAIEQGVDGQASAMVTPEEAAAVAAEMAPGVDAAMAATLTIPPAPAKGRDKRDKKKKKDKKDDKLVNEFRDYFEYSEQLGRIPPHRILAINRGEKLRILRVKIDADVEAMRQAAEELLVPAEHPHAEFLRGCARDALVRLVLPSLEREIRRELTEQAEAHAVEVFARNLRNLLLQPPVRGRRVLAVDPGFKSGCKLAALDEFGNLVAHGVVHLVGKAERKQEARTKLLAMIRDNAIVVVAVGNGTGCREADDLVADLISTDLKDAGVAYVIVNEAGASVYSTSPLGREEFPTYDATLRGAISIGRRMLDPLSELVKIDPASIGIGLYQHDVKAKHLRTSLDAVVESCVNYVGVDLNTASPALLRYVSGLNQLTARRLYDFRQQNGPFKSREQLKEVPGFGEATFVQAAGFLKITDSENPLDATWIHPESYGVAQSVLERMGSSPTALKDKETTAALAQKAAEVQVGTLAAELNAGGLLLADIISQLTRPGRDPREDLPEPIFKRGILKLDDLTPGMELTGCVLNVVDFGAFVDIGLHDSGLVHISHLANKFVRDPHDVVAVGDIVKVWVLNIDKNRRRVSLTMVQPGTERPAPTPAHKPEGQRVDRRPQRPSRPSRPAGVGNQQQGAPPQGGRRPPGRDGRPEAPVKKFTRPPKPAAPPKPLKPLTKAMKEGRAPLRTFGDLKQFVELQEKKDEPPPATAPQ